MISPTRAVADACLVEPVTDVGKIVLELVCVGHLRGTCIGDIVEEVRAGDRIKPARNAVRICRITQSVAARGGGDGRAGDRGEQQGECNNARGEAGARCGNRGLVRRGGVHRRGVPHGEWLRDLTLGAARGPVPWPDRAGTQPACRVIPAVSGTQVSAQMPFKMRKCGMPLMMAHAFAFAPDALGSVAVTVPFTAPDEL